MITEEDLKKVESNLKSVSDQLKAYAETSEKEVQKFGVMQAETKVAVDELLPLKAELQERLQDIEQKLARNDKGEDVRASTAGEIFAEHIRNNADAQKLLNKPERGRSINLEVPRSSFRAAITDQAGSGESLTYPADNVGLVQPLVQRLTIRDLLMPGRTSSTAIFFSKELGFTNNAEIQSEQLVTKGESNITFTDETVPVVTIAHFLNVSTQMLSDVPFLQSYINGRLMYGLKLKEEDQFLLGSGTGQDIEGIYTAATAYSQPSGANVEYETSIDTLRLMMLQVELADAMVSGIVLHPTDWANIELLKNADRQYLFTNPQNTTTGRLWGRDVVSTKSMTQGQTLVGDFRTHAQIFDREDANVAISFENQDNFERNKATIRVEERTTLAIYRPEAFVKGALDTPSGV